MCRAYDSIGGLKVQNDILARHLTRKEKMPKNKLTREEAISVLNHVVEYYDMNYDTGEEESTTKETNNAWNALEVLLNEKNDS